MTNASESSKFSNFFFLYFFILTLFLFIYVTFSIYNFSKTDTLHNITSFLFPFFGLLISGIYFTSTYSLSQDLISNFFSIKGAYAILFYIFIFVIFFILWSFYKLYNNHLFDEKFYYVASIINTVFTFLSLDLINTLLKIILVILFLCLIVALYFIINYLFFSSNNIDYNTVGALFFGIIFIISIFKLKNIKILMNFIKYSRLLSIILYIIFLNFLFTYYSGNVFTKYPFIFSILYILITSILFYRASYLQIYNPYFERPQRISLLICFIFLLMQLLIYNPGDFMASYGNQSILLFFLFGLFALINIFVYFFVPKEIIDKYKYSIYILFGIVFFIIFILFVINLLTNYSNHLGSNWKDWIKYLTSIFLILFIFGLLIVLLYKTYKAQFVYGNKQKNTFFDLIIDIVFYIPCFISDTTKSIFYWFERLSNSNSYFGKALNLVKNATINSASDIKNTPQNIWLALVLTTIPLIVYYSLPYLNKSIYNLNYSKTIQLLNESKPLNQLITLGTYQNLDAMTSESDPKYNYKYGISLWFYLDALPPTTNMSYSVYTPIFNYGNKPLIEYNSIKNSLRIKMGSDKSEGSKIIYESNNIKLQKWTNLIINYDGGTVDVFMDGKLLKSTENVVPYMNIDTITSGQDNGIYGEIKNVLYSSEPFTLNDVYYMPKFDLLSIIFTICILFFLFSYFILSFSFFASFSLLFIYLIIFLISYLF